MSSKTTYIALLRGINIGGHLVKMDQLRKLFSDLGLENVRSYIQTGNIFFQTSNQDEKTLKTKIETHLKSTLGYEVPVSLRTLDQLEKIISLDPFKKIELTPDTRFSITFLSEQSKADLEVPFTTPDGGYELIAKTPTELFVIWHLKTGKPSSSYGLLEKKVGVPSTTRFWHTTQKILQAAKAE